MYFRKEIEMNITENFKTYLFKTIKDGLLECINLFGHEYEFDKYDSVLVADFNYGAMENPGLIVIAEHYGEITPHTSKMLIHEMAH